MSKSNSTLTQERLREVLRYDPATGVFTWLVRHGTRGTIGRVAGTDNGSGYIKIRINGVQYYAHRLAIFYVCGHMPDVVDHKNCIRSDNSLDNLRVATDAENQHNRQRATVRSVCGLLGVGTCNSGRFDSRIKANGRSTYLGRFDTPEEAHAAYIEAKRRLQPGNLL